MTEIIGFLWRQAGPQLFFDFTGVLGPVSQPQQACDPNTVGVGNDDAWSMVDVTQDQIGGFPANTRQGQQLLHRTGHFSAIDC